MSPWIGSQLSVVTENELISLSLSYLTLCQFHWPIPTQAALIETNSLGPLKAYFHCQENESTATRGLYVKRRQSSPVTFYSNKGRSDGDPWGLKFLEDEASFLS